MFCAELQQWALVDQYRVVLCDRRNGLLQVDVGSLNKPGQLWREEFKPVVVKKSLELGHVAVREARESGLVPFCWKVYSLFLLSAEVSTGLYISSRPVVLNHQVIAHGWAAAFLLPGFQQAADLLTFHSGSHSAPQIFIVAVPLTPWEPSGHQYPQGAPTSHSATQHPAPPLAYCSTSSCLMVSPTSNSLP